MQPSNNCVNHALRGVNCRIAHTRCGAISAVSFHARRIAPREENVTEFIRKRDWSASKFTSSYLRASDSHLPHCGGMFRPLTTSMTGNGKQRFRSRSL
jgi:hypothetical protein